MLELTFLKVAGCPIFLEEETRASLPESIPDEPLGEILSKGKTVPVKIYSVAGIAYESFSTLISSANKYMASGFVFKFLDSRNVEISTSP